MDGVLVVYKEKGYTSHDVVARLRRVLGQKKIGHMGTLDPEAEGVLPVGIGSATRLTDRIFEGKKTYRAVLLLGAESDTQDAEGCITRRAELTASEEEVRAAVLSFLGSYMQLTPMYSARKIGGQKLVDLARKGREVERESRLVEISEIEILSVELPRVTFRVSCSKGAYIRTLCHDIGQKLGCGGLMESLLREKACGFNVEDCLLLGEIEALQLTGHLKEHLLTPEILLQRFPKYICSADQDKGAENGNPLPLSGDHLNAFVRSGDGVAVYSSEQKLLGLYRAEPDRRRIRPDTMLAPDTELIPARDPEPSVLSIGKFDGFHLGHQKILSEMKKVAEAEGLSRVLFSFSLSPQAILDGKTSDNLLSSSEKRSLAAELGIDRLADYPFVDEIRTMSAGDFLREILIKRLGMRVIVAGPDCAFGHNREGNIPFLRQHSEEYGYRLIEVDKVRLNGVIVSSTLIRGLLSEGRMEEVKANLGRPYTISGRVRHGEHLGSVLGFPTANLRLPRGKLLPPYGVYAARVLVDGKSYNAMADIGEKPTIPGSHRPGLECCLFDFSENMYEKKVTVELYSFRRPEKHFASVEELKAQLQRDEADIRTYFARFDCPCTAEND